MKVLKKALKVLLGLIVVVIGLLYVTGNKHILSGITKTYFIGKSKPDIDDISYHHTRTIPAEAPNQWKESVYLGEIESSDFDEEHQLYESAAYLVVHEDSVLYEKYWEGYDASCQLNSFSMAKSLLSLAVGIAIEEGHIQGVDQAAGDFLPWLKEGESAALTIENLLTMSSGIDFGESYSNPFGYQAKAYYGDDLREATSAFQVTSTPGKIWKYEGGNSVLLGIVM